MFCPPVLYYFFILEEDWTPTFIGGEMRQISLGGSPISFQDKASGGLQRCAEKVQDFLDRFDKDVNLIFSGSKDFWEEFLKK